MSTHAFRSLVGAAMQLGECPIWHPVEEALYWIDIAAHHVHRALADGREHRYWPLPSEPGCIAFTDAGKLLVAMRSGISLLDTGNGMLEPYLAPPYDPLSARFNDGRCDARGRLWLGSLYDPRDRPGGSLYCLERGRLRDLQMPVTVSNGIAFSRDDRNLYHADTTAHRIRRYVFDVEQGRLSKEEVFQQFSTDKRHNYGGRPDGAAVDSENAYWCAMYEGGRLLRFSPDGVLLEELRLPLRCPTMLAFGGPGLRTLYITSARHNRSQHELNQFPLSGHVLALDVGISGQPEQLYRM